MSRKQRYETLMAELGIRPQKFLGQNFLISDRVIQKIVEKTASLSPTVLVEVGPGLGALTEDLIKLPASLTLLEFDGAMAEYWRGQGCAVIEGDALQVDWKPLLNDSAVLVSNLPYQISSSLVIDRSLDEKKFKAMILMFQKEVAQKIMAKSGSKDYGLLSVIAQSAWSIELLLEASPKEFWPAPKIASRVLVFKSKEQILTAGYLALVKMAFSQRRKMVLKNLGRFCSDRGIENTKLLAVWEKLSLSPTARAEELTVNHFLDIYKGLEKR